jgi:[NiFe] hydrogenase diaphorase moiety small subunit
MSAQNNSDNMTFTIDGKHITAKPGQTILEAARDAGIYIPRLCHLEGVHPGGHCRLCTVLVNGRPTSACTFPASQDLVVENDTKELQGMRKRVLEMLFVEGNHVCPSCEASGNCELQALGYRLGLVAPHYPYLNPHRELDASHPDVLIDRNRCVLCGRCARASREMDGKSVFGFEGRGINKRIAVNAVDGLAGTDVTALDEAVAACPVGCLIVKRQGNRVPIGKRAYDKTPIGAELEG